MKYRVSLRAFLALLACSAMTATAQDVEKRMPHVPDLPRRALIIGMAYPPSSEKRLEQTLHDARAVNDALKDLQFQVDYVEDASRIKLEVAIGEFLEKTREGDVVFVYYAGHGMQIRGENYLIPFDYDAIGETEAQHQGYPVSALLRRLRQKKVKLTILVLDACRSSSFLPQGTMISGLAKIDRPEFTSTYIAMATLPDKTTPDKDSVFAKQLVAALRKPGLSVDDVFNDVRKQVSERTGQLQVPSSWSTSDIGEFIFRDTLQGEHMLAVMQAEADELERRVRQYEQDAIRATGTKQEELRQREEEKKELEARLQELKKDREKREEDQKQIIEAERGRKDRELKKQDALLAQQQAEARAQIEKLKQTATAIESLDENLTLEQARKIVLATRSRLTELRESMLAAQSKELAQIDTVLANEQRLVEQVDRKDTFETTAEVGQRREAQRDELLKLKKRSETARNEAIARYSAALTSGEQPLQERINALTARLYTADILSADWQNYDADHGALTVAAGPVLYSFDVTPSKAKELYEIRDKLRIESVYRYAEEGALPIRENIALVDALGDRFPKSTSSDIRLILARKTLAASDHAYWTSNRFDDFEVTASEEIERGAALIFTLQHHHSMSNVHPVRVSVSRERITFAVDPDGLWKPSSPVPGTWDKPPTHCDVGQFSGVIRNVSSIEITHNKQDEIFLRLKIREPNHSNDDQTLNFADQHSRKEEWVANTHLGIGLSRAKVRSRPEAERALTAIKHTIERAIAQARAAHVAIMNKPPSDSSSVEASKLTLDPGTNDDEVGTSNEPLTFTAVAAQCGDYDTCYTAGSKAYEAFNWPLAMASFQKAIALEPSKKEQTIYGDTRIRIGRVFVSMR